MSTLDEITKEKERIGEALARVACLAGKAGKHYCRSRRITPSVEKWRREHPHDTPPYPFMPSPTSANSSSLTRSGSSARIISASCRATQPRSVALMVIALSPWPCKSPLHSPLHLVL